MGSSAAPGGGGGCEDGGGGPVPVEEGGASLAAVVAPAEARASGGWYWEVACTESRCSMEESLASRMLRDMSSLCIL